MSIAIGIGIALGGGKPVTLESIQQKRLQRGSAVVEVDGKLLTVRKELDNFPDDVTYPSSESLMTLLTLARKIPTVPWTKERVNAAMGVDGLAAKRCAASDKLWKQYLVCAEAQKPPDLAKVRVWAEIEVIEKLLQPQTWDREQAKMLKQSAEAFRSKKLGPELIGQLTSRLRELMHNM